MAREINYKPGSQTQVNPLDLTPSVGVGLSYPFRNGLYINYYTKDQIHDNLLNTLLTEPGEKLFNPFYGVGLNSLLFEQKVDANFIKKKIEDAILSDSLLNSIKIENVKVNFDRNDNKVNVIVEWKSLLDGSSDAIEINYKNTDKI
jgi:phage baseplate assembly protein W